MARDPTFPCFLRLYMGGTVAVTRLIQFLTDGTVARLEGMPAESNVFQLVHMHNPLYDKQSAAVQNGR